MLLSFVSSGYVWDLGVLVVLESKKWVDVAKPKGETVIVDASRFLHVFTMRNMAAQLQFQRC